MQWKPALQQSLCKISCYWSASAKRKWVLHLGYSTCWTFECIWLYTGSKHMSWTESCTVKNAAGQGDSLSSDIERKVISAHNNRTTNYARTGARWEPRSSSREESWAVTAWLLLLPKALSHKLASRGSPTCLAQSHLVSPQIHNGWKIPICWAPFWKHAITLCTGWCLEGMDLSIFE